MNAAAGTRNRTASLALALALVLSARLPAQGLDYVTAHYTKQEALIPMRDGVRLFTAIYTPRERGRSFPFLMERTPYGIGPYGARAFMADLGPSPRFGREGFIFVYQDVRGQHMSEGTFVDLTPARPHAGPGCGVDESTDTFDTVAWLLQHVPGNNGRVGQWGVSYPGFYAAAGLVDAHPAMRAVSPQAPVLDWFQGDDFHHHGALWLAHLFTFIADFGHPRPTPSPVDPPPFPHPRDGYAFFLDLGPLGNADARYFKGGIPFWEQVLAHGSDDAFWRARDLRPHLRDVRPAVLTVGGWFDAENLFGSLELYRTLARQSPDTVQELVMGPWSHGGWELPPGDRLGDIAFGSATAESFQARLEFPFFMHHLKGAPGPEPRVTVFETGSNRWRSMDAWPPAEARPVELFFQDGGRLGFEPGPAGADAYPSDPARPVPYYDGVTPGMAREYMTADQRFSAKRPDVLAYASAPLSADLTLAGPIQADLWVSTTGTDADWVVKLIDGYPPDLPPDPGDPPGAFAPLAGYQQLVRGDALRGKFRDSLERPEPFVPGQPTRVQFTLEDVCHTFRRGHRLMIQVQSSWFPLMDRNPQVFTDIYHASADTFQTAEQHLYHGGARASHLTLPVLP